VSAGQVAAGLTFFLLTPSREAAPFGLALCAGVGVLAMASQAARALVRAAIGANILLAVLAGLGAVPVTIFIVAGTAPAELVPNALAGIALTAGSALSAVALWRLSSRTAHDAEAAATADGGRNAGVSESDI
jgi:hypothetical protein